MIGTQARSVSSDSSGGGSLKLGMVPHSIDGIWASRKIILTRATFLTYVLPHLACLYFMGVLVQLEGTRIYRLTLLPVLLWFAWHVIFIDMSGGDPRQAQMNTGIITQMCFLSMRATIWALAREPFRRQNPSIGNGKSGSESVYTVFWNVLDLIFSPRGIGWDWPQGLVVPEPAFETNSRLVFVLLSLGRLALHVCAFDVCVQTISMLSPDTFGFAGGGSLFDHTLPLHLELLRAVLVSSLTIWATYFAIEWSYQLMAIVAIILFQQHPSHWPPLFNSPWLSTSLTELWGRRWHQVLRQVAVVLGIRPFGHLFGRPVGIIGAFLISGIIHDIDSLSFGRGGNSVVVVGFWMMNGVGVFLEHAWKKTTGRRVGGIWGWMWTFGWLALWGVWVVDEWAMAGRLAAMALPGDIVPSVALVGFIRRRLLG